MKSYISPKVELRRSSIGKGLFALKKIRSGELVVDFTPGPGKFLSTKEAEILYRKGMDYMIQVDNGLFFAAMTKKEVEAADFINHSCDPNCGIKGSLQIVAMRDIPLGEEITFDYTMSESFPYRMKCLCGSKVCRKVITGNDWKKKDVQKKYSGFFSDYLHKKIRAREQNR